MGKLSVRLSAGSDHPYVLGCWDRQIAGPNAGLVQQFRCITSPSPERALVQAFRDEPTLCRRHALRRLFETSNESLQIFRRDHAISHRAAANFTKRAPALYEPTQVVMLGSGFEPNRRY